MKQLPCEIIEDLLPMYADELTSTVTNGMVEEHLQTCENCAKKYQLMKNPVVEESKREVKEIEF